MGGEGKPNFRQVGTKPTGAVARGAPAQPSVGLSRTVASIPSKFETVLHREPPERNAFGNRTQRFGENDNELPGPGQYHKPPSLVRTQLESGSVSRLGYSTGFVSKAKRFDDRARDAGPGPGAYQQPKSERRTENRKHGMSSFVRSSNTNQIPSTPVPGPGEYNVAQGSAAALAHNVARTSFASKTTRGFAPRNDVPAPGQYDNPTRLGQSSKSSQSAFRSNVKRLVDDGERTAALVPGPGAYNAADAERALRYDWIARAHTSAAFQTGAADRFGRMPGKLASDGELGPGSYEVRGMADNTSVRVTSSVFKSGTVRGREGGAGTSPQRLSSQVPGPAYYHPSSPDRQSHLLNANKKWL